MSRLARLAALAALLVGLSAGTSHAQPPAPPAPAPAADPAAPPAPPAPAAAPDPAKTPAMIKDVNDARDTAIKSGDVAWMLTSSAFVMLMMPGLALFYGGMARRKNVLGTMMHTMVALGIVGVQWVVIGYSLAFGDPAVTVALTKDEKGESKKGGLIGFNKELVCISEGAAIGTADSVDDVLKEKKLDPATATDEQKKAAQGEIDKKNRFKTFPNTKLPLYLHVMFQGMFAIITVALVSGAFAERVKFGAYCLFALLWTTIVYDPIAHWVWSLSWDPATALDAKGDLIPAGAAGILGVNGAIDFAGGTVVHIAAGFSGLAAILLLRKRIGYGKQTYHPNSMVLTLLGAGLLWFGWFGFNGGSALISNGQAVSAFTVTQVAAAMAGLTWTLVEWLHRGKPTALGFASGLVAGLVAITPASGFVNPSGALMIGVAAGVCCYGAVLLKGMLGYDDSLDAFGIHGVGGFLGAVMTGALVSLPLWAWGSEVKDKFFVGKLMAGDGKPAIDFTAQIEWQLAAACMSAVYAFAVTCVLVLLIDNTIGFTVEPKDEVSGLDLSQHGEVGFDTGAMDEGMHSALPKAATAPPNGSSGVHRFTVVVDGPDSKTLVKVWSALCQTGTVPPSAEFKAVYPYVTTVSGNKFRFRGGDPVVLRQALERLLTNTMNGTPVKTHVES